MSRLAVVIPVYNARTFVERTLAAILTQTEPPDEVIVVDDASQDGTPECVEAMSRSSSIPIHVIRLRRNSGGPAHPTNVGINYTQADYVAICEQDDLMLPEKLGRIRECIRRAPDVGLVLSRYQVVGGESASPLCSDEYSRFEVIPKRSLGGAFYVLENEASYRHALDRCFAVSLSNMTVSRKTWTKLGGLDESIRAVADHDFLLRVVFDYPIGFIDEPLWVFLRHAESLIRQTPTLRAEEEYGRIWRRENHISRSRVEKSTVRGLLRRNRLNVAYQYREQGDYWRALRRYCQTLNETGISGDALVGIGKLLPHLVRSQLWKKH